jgi:hypothetical protein
MAKKVECFDNAVFALRQADKIEALGRLFNDIDPKIRISMLEENIPDIERLPDPLKKLANDLIEKVKKDEWQIIGMKDFEELHDGLTEFALHQFADCECARRKY